jgi:hypothetical protein
MQTNLERRSNKLDVRVFKGTQSVFGCCLGDGNVRCMPCSWLWNVHVSWVIIWTRGAKPFFVFQQLESIELFLVFVAKRVVPNLLLL